MKQDPLIEHHKEWLSQENRLRCWNHLRDRRGLEPFTLEEAAEMMNNSQIEKDVKDFMDSEAGKLTSIWIQSCRGWEVNSND